MTTGTTIFLTAVTLLAIYFVVLYNNLVTLKHNIARTWSNIDVLLKQRHDELPKLIEVCKQYKAFEQETLKKVIAARANVFNASQNRNITALGTAETTLRSSLGQLFAVAEAYPELRSSEQFSQLSFRISQLEDAIADRRELYNETVNLHNIRIEQFPDAIVAQAFGFSNRPQLRFGRAETTDIDVKATFG